MTKEEIVAEVEKAIGPLNERDKQVIEAVTDLIQKKLALPTEPKWQGENPPLEQMLKLTDEERIRIMDELADANRDWLERKRIELGARWMLVVDGQILAHGPTFENYPSDEEIEDLCRRTGKMLLFHEAPLLIEEVSLWSATIYPADFYPTLPVTFTGNGQSTDVVADFDTGSPDCVVDADMLASQGIIQIAPFTPWRRSSHLGQDFWYTRRSIEISLTAEDGTRSSVIHRVLCVRNWRQSPFVAINPNRVALVGRDLCLSLKPQVNLNFAQHQTTVHF
ncbi:MAG: hypothetical protein NZ805_13230 [Armatimonadetes bacterium]|nr:hypothetical protein [Armatimonadota bacterium]MDW8029204.1 hypothetical protein [Armatimonadota bacterium]